MTAALKTLLPQFETVLGANAGKLYERMRALKISGQLQHRAGRGPGSGIAATPDAAAMLLLSLLASDVPSIGAEGAQRLGAYVPVGFSHLSNHENLRHALAWSLGDQARCVGLSINAARNRGIIDLVSCYDGTASFTGTHPIQSSVFVLVSILPPGLRKIAQIIAPLPPAPAKGE